MTLVTHTYLSGEAGFATFRSAANGTRKTTITAGVLSVDVIPGLTYVRTILQTWTSDEALVIIPATGPIDLAYLIPQTATPATVGVLTSTSIGTVVAGFSAIGQVLDRSGNPVTGGGATTDAGALATGTLADARLSTATATTLAAVAGNTTAISNGVTALTVEANRAASAELRLTNRAKVISAALGDLSYLRGINLSGPEFSPSPAQLPGAAGTDFFYPVAADFTYLASRGHKTVRLPIRWERIQPTLNAPLAAGELTRLLGALSNAAAAGLIVNVEVHNFGRFINSTANGGTTLTLNDGVLTNANLVDLWTRLSAALKGNPALWSYGLMNEPNSLPNNPGTWTPTTTLYDFEVNALPWAANSATVARSTTSFHDGAASLQVTANSLTVAYSKQFDANDGGNSTFSAAGGPTLAAWVLVPAGTTGSNWQAKFLLQDNAYANNAGPSYNLTPGTWAQIMYSPGSALLGAHRQLSVQFTVDNPATTTAVVYIDTVQQGSVVGALSSSRVWEIASQAVVTALRAAGDNTLIMVPGYAYSSASQWTNNHAVPWITDPAANFNYEAHYYFDRDNSGVYANTYAAETTDATNRGYSSLTARALAEMSVFTGWCTANGVQGFIGEVGWPNTGDTASWNAVGNALLAALDSKGIPVTVWATGSAYGGGYILSVYTGSPLSVATTIATAVEAHPSASTGLTQVSTRAPLLTPTATKTAAYTAAVGDLALMNVAGGGTTLTLPAAPADKAQVGYRAIGATSAVPLVINVGAGDTIGTAAATTVSIPLADETVVVQYAAATKQWLAVSNARTQAALDGRYIQSSGNVVASGGLGINGKASAPLAAAIASPTSDTVGTKAAIDAIRAALANVGITA